MEWNIRADRPVYLQLLEQLEAAVASGAYAPGERLPGVRELAAQAGVNPNTMQRALAELETRGLVRTQRTAGRTVTDDAQAIASARRALAMRSAREFLAAAHALRLTNEEAAELLAAAIREE